MVCVFDGRRGLFLCNFAKRTNDVASYKFIFA